MKFTMLFLAMAAFAIMSTASAAFVGSATIHAPAVITSTNQGALTTIVLNVTTGNGSVSIKGPLEVGSSTQQSALVAAQYACSYLGLNFSSYNFTYYISNASMNVSGPSAGTAMTLLAISALSHRPLRQDFTVTGTISPSGQVGEIGGVYDKAQAAHLKGMEFVIVPAVPKGSMENLLYYLVQQTFSIPLVQASNITQAASFAFNYTFNPSSKMTNYTFYTNYSVSSLPEASLSCSNNCNNSIFNMLVNFTFAITSSQIDNLSASSKFSNASFQLGEVLNQSESIARRGYLYTGADLSFLDYINAFYLNHRHSTIKSGMETLQNISYECSMLTPPQLTNTNYEYVVGAELRQAWANYTLNSTISLYNITAVDTDGVLDSLYSGGEASGWCAATSFLYNASSQMGGTPISFSPSLKAIAAQRLERASKYPGLYYYTAQKAYEEGNYPVAIIDADYAYSLSSYSNATTEQINNHAYAIAQNSTYGVWATQYANEALFYVHESMISSNSTIAHNYAEEAYSVAVLANHVSNDTRLLQQNMVVEQLPSQSQLPLEQIIPAINELQVQVAQATRLLYMVMELLTLVIVLFTVTIILFVYLLNKQSPKHSRANLKRRK
ncbi:MAG: S16 family serine protease [Candidatus Micrarchaeia archaeon]